MGIKKSILGIMRENGAPGTGIPSIGSLQLCIVLDFIDIYII